MDLSWLFQWSHAALYNFVHGLVPVDPNDPTANRERADQIAVGALGLLDALMRLLAAWMLLKIRHRGPGTVVVGHLRDGGPGRRLPPPPRRLHGRDRAGSRT